ncbi:MAG: carB [Rickettsiaceae bacterium]|nr:carB [Rickettsiaceae bacterium]
MRNASLAVLREIGVDTGGSNVQFAVNPDTGKLVVIEMNPRVSRSSALASKATGFPIAKVAAKLAVGYTLDEIKNDCTEVTPASFEPVIDYVVTKIPRFNFEKFKGTEPTLTSAMKSVGEAMAIGRNFAESLQKALRSLETGLSGLDEIEIGDDIDAIRASLSKVTPDRLRVIVQAIRQGVSFDEIYAITKFDRWYLEQFANIVAAEEQVKKYGIPEGEEQEASNWLSNNAKEPRKLSLLELKRMGFSDKRLAKLAGVKADKVRQIRQKANVHPVYKRVDTCAAEFESSTPYMYSSYEGDASNGAECEAFPSDKKKVIILGGGPNRIGQGIEFDYCCVHAVYALQEAGYETIMVNCNPETVSTDYDTADRLYFEPLTEEDVLEIVRVEQSKGTLHGMIVQYGGQTPLKLARGLEAAGVPIIGTSPDAIDLAEDRERFKALIHKLNLRQPENDICYSFEEVEKRAETMGFPVVVRPSYVLGGSNMAIVQTHEALLEYLRKSTIDFEDGPLLLDGFLQDAVEVDVDAIADGKDVYIAGIMEHIEEAGIHSGDSACSLPPYSLSQKLINEIKEQTCALALALKVRGLMNVQFAVQGENIFILEVNPRASRTVPFVAKSTNVPIAKIAARVMAGETLASFDLKEKKLGHIAVKEAVLPFARFPNVDVLLGPEMKSTGEAMGLDRDFGSSFAKSQLSAGNPIPTEGTVFISVKDRDKKAVLDMAHTLQKLGYKIIATRGTASFLEKAGIGVAHINKVLEGRPHIVDIMKDGGVSLVINTTEGASAIADSFSIRRTALLNKIPYSTTIAGSKALVKAIERLKEDEGLAVFPLQSYFN